MKNKENINMSVKIARAAAAVIIGANLVSGCKPLEDLRKDLQRYDCSGSNSCPPENGIEVRTREFNNGFVKMDETLKWNPDNNRWRITDRQWSAVPQEESIFDILNDYNNQTVASELIKREKFFSPPIDQNECKMADWNNSQYVINYCWDEKTKSWQEQFEGSLINTMR